MVALTISDPRATQAVTGASEYSDVGTYREFVETNYGGFERSCLSKARFDSRREARSMVRNGRRSNGQLEAYHCSNCDAWHLGHHRSPKDRRARSRPWRYGTQLTWTTSY